MGETTTITVKGDVDPAAVEQLERCARAGDAPAAALCADGHLGYSQPIGGVVAYRDKISPSGVGYDIGCGNKAVKTNIRVADILTSGHSGRPPQVAAGENPLPGATDKSQGREVTPEWGLKNEAPARAYSRCDRPITVIMDEIVRRISFGMGRPNDEPVDHPVLDKITQAPFVPQRALAVLAASQLGTVGSGNHYVDLFEDEDGWLWVGVHFGSRGFGHKTASGFLAMAEGKRFGEHATEGEMHSPPILFDVDSEIGQHYIEAMSLAGEYAYAGRDVVVDRVLEILGAEAVEGVHNHHNFAWLEEHDGEKMWVIRKGATPAFPGQKGFVGATMGEPSVILEGVESPESAGLLYSTVHGAGRVMSRTQAAGKIKRRKFWRCADCDYQHTDGAQPCPDHGRSQLRKAWRHEQVRPGVIDFDAVKADLIAKGIELRGAAADEAPAAYKRLSDVLAHHGDTIRVLHTLTPIGVAMAGPDIFDPFKD